MQRNALGTPSAKPSGSFGTLGVIAFAFGIGVLGAYMLDLHGHQCCKCGHRWRHLGAFNFGDEPAHTCVRCGTVQWWKDGIPHAFRAAHDAAHAAKEPVPVDQQDFRSRAFAALPSGEVTRRW